MTLNLLALSIVIVVAGRWTSGKTIDPKIVVGGLLAAVMLTAMEQANAKLAQGFAVILFLAAAYTYIPVIAGSKGVREGGKR